MEREIFAFLMAIVGIIALAVLLTNAKGFGTVIGSTAQAGEGIAGAFVPYLGGNSALNSGTHG